MTAAEIEKALVKALYAAHAEFEADRQGEGLWDFGDRGFEEIARLTAPHLAAALAPGGESRTRKCEQDKCCFCGAPVKWPKRCGDHFYCSAKCGEYDAGVTEAVEEGGEKG